ncbi:uracil-DNA glycosylase [Salinibius halmophilus]|uniref:uracil-DNA glycosylase n=1 Tax=Salinibius halmophilus TaxID=1853216 RepID=UPI000E660D15|nr:uracil-DNA glycosylase [Salinibius halmophilus]
MNLASGWQPVLEPHLAAPSMQQLRDFLASEVRAGKTIFPAQKNVFRAFEALAFSDVKVVILGQDPYHGPGQAEGLSFSVPPGVPAPPSLKNIYKEMVTDVGLQPPNHGHLMHWVEQGVLLLNTVLTVEAGQAGSHQKRGWEQFTDAVIQEVNARLDNVVFMLWGAPARKKAAMLDSSRHCVLEAPHPSPLSAHRGFFGCQHFSKANVYLRANNRPAINWQLPE